MNELWNCSHDEPLTNLSQLALERKIKNEGPLDCIVAYGRGLNDLFSLIFSTSQAKIFLHGQ